MATSSVSTVVRTILNGDVDVPADEVVRKARDQGITVSDSSIRDAIYNVKSDLRKKAKGGGKKTAPKPTSTKSTSKPVPAAARATKIPPPVLVTVTSPGLDLSTVLANVALVNAVAGACGGPEPARKVAEAVKACGGVDAFLQHLDLVAQVRG